MENEVKKVDFAFIIITYNQESYIELNLESIRNIIEKYGSGKNVELIICDDHSLDGTVNVIKRWIDDNGSIFYKTQLVCHPENVGTIQNIYSGIDVCSAKNGKIIAGDDAFNDKNVLIINDEIDFVITPTIKFAASTVLDNNHLDEYYLRLLKSNDIKKTLKSMLSYDQILLTPGVFASLKFWRDPNIKDVLLKYRYIEDYPMWHYIFNNYDKEFTIGISSIPYVLYRQDVGVSNRKYSPIADEKKRIEIDLQSRHFCKYKYLNIYNYDQAIKNLYIKFLMAIKEDVIVRNSKLYEDECKVAKKYLRKICSKLIAHSKEENNR